MAAKPTLVQLILNATAAGKSMLTAANAAAQKTLLSLVKGDVGLGNVDNTSDVNKPVSSAQQTALDAKQATLVSGTNIKTVNSSSLLGSGDLAISGLSGTGSVDNAALRSDGTGGATLQNSAWIINDNLTASPNNTVNHACLEATGGTTNVSVSIKPKGTGSFSLHPPDGTVTGGNARGANAVDLQTVRYTATQVGSGAGAFVAGKNNTASGLETSIVMGYENIGGGANVYDPIAIGVYNFVSGAFSDANYALGKANTVSTAAEPCGGALGNGNAVSGNAALGTGYRGRADRYGMRSHAAGYFDTTGDSQEALFVARNKTTSAVATELYLNGSSTRLTIPSGKILSALVRVTGVKSDGSEVIKFLRDVTIKNVGGTTTVETAAATIGTDINVSGATLDLSADNTNDSLKIEVTPPTGTWRWVAVVEGIEIAYGT
jgi:hypothetical protein